MVTFKDVEGQEWHPKRFELGEVMLFEQEAQRGLYGLMAEWGGVADVVMSVTWGSLMLFVCCWDEAHQRSVDLDKFRELLGDPFDQMPKHLMLLNRELMSGFGRNQSQGPGPVTPPEGPGAGETSTSSPPSPG